MKVKYLVMLLTFACFNPVSAEVRLPEFNQFVKNFADFINPYTKKVGASREYNIVLIDDRNFSAWFKDPIEISRGVLDSPHTTIDALALVACHEVGHDKLVAKKFLPNGIVFGWNHLLQDYFASYACLKPFLKQSKSYGDLILTRKQLDEIPIGLQAKCEASNSVEVDVQICLRILHASISVIKALSEDVLIKEEYIRNGFPEPAFDREWIGPGDHLQGRLITFKSGIFREEPFLGPF